MNQEQMGQQTSLQEGIAQLPDAEKAQMMENFLQIQQIVQQLIAQGATQADIEQFLADIGLTLEDLQFIEQLLTQEANNMGFTD
jgi:hypothetical protein